MFGSLRRHINARTAGVVVSAFGAGIYASKTIGLNRHENKMSGRMDAQTTTLLTGSSFPLMMALSPINFLSNDMLSVSECHAAGDSCCKEPATVPTPTKVEKSKTAVSKVVEVTTESFEEVVLKSDKDVFVVFYAPWCGYCKRLVPVWQELAEETQDTSSVVIAQVDMTQHSVAGANITIHGYPTIYLFKKGRKEAPIEYRGGRDVVSFVAFLEFYTNM